MIRTALAAAATTPLLLLTAAPAQASTSAVISVGAVARLQDAGSYIGLPITYQCDPGSVSRAVDVQVWQVTAGRMWQTDESYAPRFCTGTAQTSRVKVYREAGQPRFHTGPVTVIARTDVFYTDGHDEESDWISRRVTIR